MAFSPDFTVVDFNGGPISRKSGHTHNSLGLEQSYF